MRRDGDRLIAHVAAAKETVLLCAPFVKVRVLKNLLRHIGENVSVKIVTRWLPSEVALGVSDLEVLDVVHERPKTSLWLLDRLHAKIYSADGRVSGGSANLTATAMGWSDSPNLELLMDLDANDESVRLVMDQLSEARPATVAEREKIAELAKRVEKPTLDTSRDMDVNETPTIWLPQLPAPNRLYQAYVERLRERVPSDTLEAADKDLKALGVPPSLNEKDFNDFVANALPKMPAITKILLAAADDLTDEAGVAVIRDLGVHPVLPPELSWHIVREWLTHFLRDKYEIAPQAFVLRPRPGAGRS
jgi:hypothetical protein